MAFSGGSWPPGPKSGDGAVTSISGGEIFGWCRDPLEPEVQQGVDLLIDGYYVGGLNASSEDVDETGEFCLKIPSSFRDGREHTIQVNVRGSRICLGKKTVILSADT